MIGKRKISLPCHAVHGSRKSEQKRLDNRRRGPAVVGGKMQRAFPERAFLLKCIPPNRLTEWACPSFSAKACRRLRVAVCLCCSNLNCAGPYAQIEVIALIGLIWIAYIHLAGSFQWAELIPLNSVFALLEKILSLWIISALRMRKSWSLYFVFTSIPLLLSYFEQRMNRTYFTPVYVAD